MSRAAGTSGRVRFSTLDRRLLTPGESIYAWPYRRPRTHSSGVPVPTYEYRCESCRKSYDLHEGFSAATTHTCQRCKKGIAKRVLHAPRVVFKGSGFYATDSRKGGSTEPDSAPKTTSLPAAASEGSSPAKSEGSGSRDSGAKPDAGAAAAT